MIPCTARFWLISVWTLSDRELNVVEWKREITSKTQLYNESAEMTIQIKTVAKILLRRRIICSNYCCPLSKSSPIFIYNPKQRHISIICWLVVTSKPPEILYILAGGLWASLVLWAPLPLYGLLLLGNDSLS